MQKQSNINLKEEQKLESGETLQTSSDDTNNEAVEALKQAIEKRDDNPQEC